MDAGVGIAMVLLLWPADNSWPPEIDFCEDDLGYRNKSTATLHWSAKNLQL